MIFYTLSHRRKDGLNYTTGSALWWFAMVTIHQSVKRRGYRPDCLLNSIANQNHIQTHYWEFNPRPPSGSTLIICLNMTPCVGTSKPEIRCVLTDWTTKAVTSPWEDSNLHFLRVTLHYREVAGSWLRLWFQGNYSQSHIQGCCMSNRNSYLGRGPGIPYYPLIWTTPLNMTPDIVTLL